MKRNRIPALLTALALTLSMTAPALADTETDHVAITGPKDGAVYYIGEAIPLRATLTEYTLPKYGTRSTYELAFANVKTEKTLWSRELGDSLISSPDGDVENTPIDFEDGLYKFSKNLKTSGYAAGKYTFEISFFGRLTEESAEIADESDDYSGNYRILEDAAADLTLKQLKPPTKLKASAGKRKVTLSWKKAGGAKKYKIQRSAKKKSGYKTVATVKSSKKSYTDKKVKRGKQYYYRIVSVRGSAKCKYTAPVRCRKVK